MARATIPDSQRFFNRHLSWMQFNQRVLEEARDPGNPLLERVKFLGITASNLDEFVEVRLAGLMQQVEHGNSEPSADGRIPEQALADNLKTRMLLPDGEYVRLHETRRFASLRNGHRFNAQDFLIEFTEGRLNLDSVPPVPAFLSRLRPTRSTLAESSE